MADEAPQSVILHHPSGIPGFSIKTRSGVHYTYNEKGELEIPGHLVEHHIKELTHVSRGHRVGKNPAHMSKKELASQEATP